MIKSANGNILNIVEMSHKGEVCKGTILVVHGMGEHLGRYEDFANYFVDHGYNVVRYDHIGHGESINTKEELGDFKSQFAQDILVGDLKKVIIYVSKKYAGDLVLLGHSLGSVVLRTALSQDIRVPVKKVILSGSNKDRNFLIYDGGIFLSRLVAKIKGTKYRSKFIDSLILPKGNSWLSENEVQNEKFAKDPLCGFIFTSESYETIIKLGKIGRFKKIVKKLPKFQYIILNGSEDILGGKEKGIEILENQFRKHKLNVTVIPAKGCRHEVLNSINKIEIYDKILKEIN